MWFRKMRFRKKQPKKVRLEKISIALLVLFYIAGRQLKFGIGQWRSLHEIQQAVWWLLRVNPVVIGNDHNTPMPMMSDDLRLMLLVHLPNQRAEVGLGLGNAPLVGHNSSPMKNYSHYGHNFA